MPSITDDEMPAVTMVVPTRNRAHTLRLVAESFYVQDLVDEIIYVDDAGEDTTPQLLDELTDRFPDVHTVIMRNDTRLGAAECRNRGAAVARNGYILFCDDDEMLEPGYARTCLRKLMLSGAGAVSGRRVYMRNGETPDAALRRFGSGIRSGPPYRALLCEHVTGARFSGDIEVPFANAVIITPTALVRQYGFDPAYARGNGYREETDYQMNLFVSGHRILMTAEVHSIHLSPAQVRTGGQRVNRWRRLYWTIFYTAYFYRKYWDRYRTRLGIRMPRRLAVAWFAVFATYREMLRPTLYRMVFAVMRLRGSTAPG
ncbi:MAG: glycosyltransferase family 2 protein [Alphaproteobacteria bacterium]|nr:glycosyltransferase family 2 protein [Alphaproteobacteria bacterium]